MARVAMTYNISTDREAVWVYDGKQSQGVFEMRVVGGGDQDGQLICAGEGRMSAVLLGMMRLAAFAHEHLQHDENELRKVLLGEGPVGSDQAELRNSELIVRAWGKE